jgi:hypothetical protein
LHAHERSLVARYAGRPFVLLGVNLDPDPTRRAEQAEAASRWGVHGLPAVFLIDARGVVRLACEGLPDIDQLDRKIEELLKEAE